MGRGFPLWFLILLGIAAPAFAGRLVYYAGGYDSGCCGFPWWMNPDRITIFDDRVFDLSAPSVPSEHPYGEPAEYNAAQRAQWIKKCAPLKRTDFAAFRRCFEEEKENAAVQVQKQFDEVERRVEQPLQNIPQDSR